MITEKHYVRVKYLDNGPHFVMVSLLKPLPDVTTAMGRAREIAKQSGRRVSIRVESVTGTIKRTINGDGMGGVIEKPGAV